MTLSVTMYVRVGMSVGVGGGLGQEKPGSYIVWLFLVFSFTVGRFFSCLLWLIYTLNCQIISLKSNQYPRN